MAEGLLKTCIKYGVVAVREPENYEARANLMWASSHAINGLISLGKDHPWSVHSMEHQLSAYYDITHGVGLAILTPAWMDAILSDQTVDKFVDFAVNVWGIAPKADKFETAKEGIAALRNYFKELGIPATLPEVGIKDETHFDVMAEKSRAGRLAQGLRSPACRKNQGDLSRLHGLKQTFGPKAQGPIRFLSQRDASSGSWLWKPENQILTGRWPIQKGLWRMTFGKAEREILL